jgi:transglutaminase-like putative cysteine protease
MSLVKIWEGLNESNRPLYVDNSASTVVDNGNWTITLPAPYPKSTAIPTVKAVGTYGAGADGARTFTYKPVVDVGSLLVGIEVVNYVETTGVLTLTNRAGASLTDIITFIEVIGDTK